MIEPVADRGPGIDTVVLSVSESRGIVPQESRFRRRIALNDVSKYRIVRYGDIIYNPFLLWNGAVGACFLHEGGCVSPAYVVLRPKVQGTSRFLHYLLRSRRFKDAVDNIASGSVTRRRTAPIDDILDLELNVPDVKGQLGISSFLDVLDGKIDLNTRISWALERILRTLFKSWFVEFDPTRPRPRAPRDVEELFPGRLADSQVGLIPEGWNVAALGDHVEVTRGLSYRGDALADEGLPLHNLNSIREGGGYKVEGIKYYVGDHRPRDQVEPGDVLVANTDLTQNARVIGCPAIVPRIFGGGLYSQDLCRVRLRVGSPLTPQFLYLLLASHRMRHQVASYANGTTVLHLAMDALKEPLFAVPPPALAREFAALVAPMFDQQEALLAQSRTLAQTRDAVVPGLMSGAVRIAE